MKKQTYQIGQKVMIEGTANEYIYFVEKGEFEVTKNIYIHPKRNLKFYEYLRFISTRDENFLGLLLNPDTKILYSPNKYEYDMFKITQQGLQKKIVRVCQTGINECFGLIESYVDCPYSLQTVVCRSKDATIFKIK